MRHLRSSIHIYALAAVVAFITLRIEWLNAESGGRLPNREYFNNDPAQVTVKWRAGPPVVESEWRRRNGIDDRPLTVAEQSQLDSESRRERANNSLRDFVGSAGLLQYLLAPALVVASLMTIGAKGVRYGIVPLGVGIAAGVMMFWRTYFTSLGW